MADRIKHVKIISGFMVMITKSYIHRASEKSTFRQKTEKSHGTLSFSSVLIMHLLIILFLFTGCSKKKEDDTEEATRKKWATTLSSEVYYGSPALSRDEKTVYVGTSSALLATHGKDQFFVALDAATGKEKWQLSLGINEVRSSPAISSDNSIFFTVELRNPADNSVLGDELWHISAEGSLIWKYNINPQGLSLDVGLSSPAIGPDGNVYVAGDKLYSFTPGGSLRWAVFGNTFEALRNAPVIGKDGTVYFVFHNIPLTALDPVTGNVIWSCELGVNDHCFASPAIGPEGTIYVPTQPGLLYAVSSSGQLLWTFNLASAGFSGTMRSSPAVDAEGCIYFGINYGSPASAFFALHPDGTLKWKFEPADLPADVDNTHFDIYSSPALGTDSLVYFGQEFGRVYALKRSDGSMAWMETVKQGITWSSPAIDHKGVLYINDLSGSIYAFQTGSMGLDTLASWPKFRFDNRNTGYKH